MSIKQIIKESVEKNPLGLKEALEEELRGRVALALEAKMSEMYDDEDEDEDDLDETSNGLISYSRGSKSNAPEAVKKRADYEANKKAELKRQAAAGKKNESFDLSEAASFQSVLKAHEYTGNGKDYTWRHGRTKVTHYGDHAVSYNDADGRKVHKTPSHLNNHLNMLHDNEINMRSLKESFDLSDLTLEELEDFMMSEDFDQLDEISMEKLKAYHKAAKGDADTRSIKQAEGDGGRGNIKKFLNRKRGMELAVRKAGKKVMGEEFNLDEVKKK